MSLNQQLREIIAYGYQHAPALQRIMAEAGLTPADIQSVADLPKIPITSKDRLLQMQRQEPPFGGWLAAPPHQLQRIFVSPGPIFEPEAALEQWDLGALTAIGLGPGDIVLNTFAYHWVSAGLFIDAATRALGATVVPTGPGNTEHILNIMMTLQATGYLGTPSFLKIILDKAEELGVARQDIPLKKCFFSAEPYPPSLRSTFEQQYGMVTAGAYATAELGIVAYDHTGDPSAWKLVRHLIVEIADLETGEPVPPGQPGQVVVTTFNKTYPLVRFGLGDLSAFVGQPDAEGFYTHIKGWLGRVGDAVKVRGMFLHPLQLKQAVARFEETGNVQAIVTRPQTRDYVTLRVELDNAGVDQTTLADEVAAAVSQACRLRVDEVEFVPPGAIETSARVVVDKRDWQ